MDHYKTWQLNCSSHGYYLTRFWRSIVGKCYFSKFWMYFFKVMHYFAHISGMVGPIDVKRKRSASVGYWIWYVTLTFDSTHDLDLGCFKVEFRNSCISGIVGLIDVEWKGSKLRWYWMTLPFDHTHDLGLGVSGSVWNSFISGMGRPIDMERKGWVNHTWPSYWLVWPGWGGRMYQIVTGVISDVWVPSTYSVGQSDPNVQLYFHSSINRTNKMYDHNCLAYR